MDAPRRKARPGSRYGRSPRSRVPISKGLPARKPQARWNHARLVKGDSAVIRMPSISKPLRRCVLFAGLLVPFLSQAQAVPSETKSRDVVSTEQFGRDVSEFLGKELSAHLSDIRTPGSPQERVEGALTLGEFSWGTFSRALASYSALTGNRALAGRDLPQTIGKIGLIEARGGGKAFAQMYAAIALRSYGTDLGSNPLWQSLTPQEQTEWRALLDPARFYDRKTRHVIDLPENYFGVAARVATMDYQMGLIADRTYIDDLLEQAAAQFVKGAMYSDDNPPTGRFDRYS